MQSLIPRTRGVLAKLQERFIRSRPGSVLVLVIALLVLLALIGTAYISTTRTDRAASAQNSYNTQIDLIVQGVVNMVETTISHGVFFSTTTTAAIAVAPGQSVPLDSLPFTNGKLSGSVVPGTQLVIDGSTSSQETVTVKNVSPATNTITADFLNAHAAGATVTALSTPDDYTTDPWLSSRVPVTLAEVSSTWDPAQQYGNGDFVVYSSKYYVSIQTANVGNQPDTAPTWWTLLPWPGTRPVWNYVSTALAAPAFADPFSANPFTDRTTIVPDSLTLHGQVYPAVSFYNTTNHVIQNQLLAASASGNGIADSILWRLPMSPINGVAYYAAIRVVDDNSAVNVNTAWSRMYDFGFDGRADQTLSLGMFPSNVGLAEMLKTFAPVAAAPSANQDTQMGSEILALNQYRFNSIVRPVGVVGASSPDMYPRDDSNIERTDFQYLTLGDAFSMGVGRRPDRPGIILGSIPPTGVSYRPIPQTDAVALAYRFDLVNTLPLPSPVETALSDSLYYKNAAHTQTYQSLPWNADQWAAWFTANYDYGNEGSTYPASAWTAPQAYHSRRPLVVVRNPTSNQMAVHPMDSLPTTQPSTATTMPYSSTSTAPRASINTASFGELWRAFWNVMTDATSVGDTAVGTRQVRSSLRDPNTTGTYALSAEQQVFLRAALAAINAMDLRDSDNDITSCQVNLTARPVSGAALGAPVPVQVTLYGTERQPYITEIYADNDNASNPLYAGKTNPKGYVAVELYNPYSTAIDLTGWSLGIVDRRAASAAPAPGNPYPSLRMVPITGFTTFDQTATFTSLPAGLHVIPAGGYLILENMLPTGVVDVNGATYRASSAFTAGPPAASATVSYAYVPNLHEVMQGSAYSATTPGGELYLLRPRAGNGVFRQSILAGDKYNEGSAATPALEEMVPVDAFDFTGLTQVTTPPFSAIHYARVSGFSATTSWRWVYPGRWAAGGWTTGNTYRQEGTNVSQWDPAGTGTPLPKSDPWDPSAPDYVATANPFPSTLGAAVATPSYTNKFPAVQLNNADFAGPAKLVNLVNRFPFGGFARNGDVLQVPFIGGYRIKFLDASNNPVPGFLEMNPVTMDSAFADDDDTFTTPPGPGPSAPTVNGTANDASEQLGRFCPIKAATPGFGPQDTYSWASHILDYLSVQSPNDDYLPNTEPQHYTYYDASTGEYSASAVRATPQAVPSIARATAATANQGNEDNVGNDGLININTAPWKVIAALPMLPNDAAANAANAAGVTPAYSVSPADTSINATNEALAKAIVAYRVANGPFKNIFELNKVPANFTGTPSPGFQDLYGPASSTDYDDIAGDISPGGTGNLDYVINDFEKRMGMVTRISNLATTHSDTFTVYILVQGWKYPGTPNAQLVVQRRVAFIADRSGVTSANRTLKVTNVPTN